MTPPAPRQPGRSFPVTARAAACVAACATVAALLSPAFAQAPAHAQPVAPPADAASARVKPPAVKVTSPKSESKPTWAELKPAEQAALAPLAGSWSTLTEAHKRKWIALSANYPQLPPAEQARVHSRMAEWAALSPQQRTQARLNFAETKKVPLEDKKAAWEAYQALPPEEKRKLAAGAAAAKPSPPPTAAAVRPVPQQKLATVPKHRKTDAKAPRVAGAPDQVDHHTLLPHPGSVAGP